MQDCITHCSCIGLRLCTCGCCCSIRSATRSGNCVVVFVVSACIGARAYRCNHVPVHQCTDTRVSCRCIGVPLYQCLGISVCQCVGCAGVFVYQCIDVLVYLCTGAPVHQCTSVPVYRCTNVLMYRRAGLFVYLCTSVLVHQ